MKEKISAVIVLYNPNLKDLIKNLDLVLANGCNDAYLINNSKYDIDLQEFHNVNIINLNKNIGIAAAQNIGMNLAFKNGAEYILQFDQDSIIHPEMIFRLLNSYKSLIDEGINVGLISPQTVDKDTNEFDMPRLFKGKIILSDHLFEVPMTLSSGTLISKSIYEKLGGMMDNLFIDLVDFEYCWRVRRLGFKVVLDKSAILYHKLGEGNKSFLGLIKYGIPAPFRHYYAIRNSIFLILYYPAPFFWKISTSVKIMLKFMFYPFLLDNGYKRLIYMSRGFKDGVLKSFNKINQ